MTRRLDVEVVADAGAELGESPVWDDSTQRLLWVDIAPGTVHQLDVSSSADHVLEIGPTIGAVALRRDGGLLLARRNGFAMLERDGTVIDLVDVEPGRAENRMNDGKCDPAGRFWAGSIVLDKNSASAALYRLDADFTTRSVRTGVTVSNGIGWSPDATAMYYIDSLAGGVDVYAYDLPSGEITGRRRFVDIPFEHGEPDGLTVDESGCVWFAIWRAGEVRRYTPTGDLDTIVSVPASRSTSCCFGGSALDTLFITSARCDLTPDQLAAEPHAGAVFACRPGTTGLPSTPFATHPT
jgi:sugar lactone lactonase YvrE